MKVGDIVACVNCNYQFNTQILSDGICSSRCYRQYGKGDVANPLADLPGEEWRDVVGYEELYQVSNFSRVKSLKRPNNKSLANQPEMILKQRLSVRGYMTILLVDHNPKKTFMVHRLVAMAFIHNPENKPCVNHKNGVKDDNRLVNLEFCTASENQKHAYRTGLRAVAAIGSTNGNSVLKESDILEMFEMEYRGEPHYKIGKAFGVSRRTVGLIIRRQAWSHVEIKEKRVGVKSARTLLSENDVVGIFKMKSEGFSNKDIQRVYNTSESNVLHIIRRTYWRRTTIPQEYIDKIEENKKKK